VTYLLLWGWRFCRCIGRAAGDDCRHPRISFLQCYLSRVVDIPTALLGSLRSLGTLRTNKRVSVRSRCVKGEDLFLKRLKLKRPMCLNNNWLTSGLSVVMNVGAKKWLTAPPPCIPLSSCVEILVELTLLRDCMFVPPRVSPISRTGLSGRRWERHTHTLEHVCVWTYLHARVCRNYVWRRVKVVVIVVWQRVNNSQ